MISKGIFEGIFLAQYKKNLDLRRILNQSLFLLMR